MDFFARVAPHSELYRMWRGQNRLTAEFCGVGFRLMQGAGWDYESAPLTADQVVALKNRPEVRLYLISAVAPVPTAVGSTEPPTADGAGYPPEGPGAVYAGAAPPTETPKVTFLEPPPIPPPLPTPPKQPDKPISFSSFKNNRHQNHKGRR